MEADKLGHPSALEVVAATLGAVIAPLPDIRRASESRDLDFLTSDGEKIARHFAVADRAASEMAATRERLADRPRPAAPGTLAMTLSSDISLRVRAEADRLGEEPAALALAILAAVFDDDLVAAVLNRPKTV